MAKCFVIAGALAILSGVHAFSPEPHLATRSSTVMAAKFSKSLPFLIAPKKLDGSMVGDVGFDPMELSEIQVDLIYARAAEIKHGRIAQLAVTGFLAQEVIGPVLYPGVTEHNPLKALAAVPAAANIQILIAIAIVELTTFNYTYGSDTPWNLGWGAGLLKGKSDAAVRDQQLKELTHGRAAMIAFVGMLVQTLIYDKPLLGGVF